MSVINVIGLGYIGLPTALMFASRGVEIVGTDYNQKLVDTLNSGKTTFKGRLKKAVRTGTENYVFAVRAWRWRRNDAKRRSGYAWNIAKLHIALGKENYSSFEKGNRKNGIKIPLFAHTQRIPAP